MDSDTLSNDLFARLVSAATCYPRDLFPPLSAEAKAKFPELIAAASAEMARTLAPLLTEAAVAILRATDGAAVSARGRESLEGLGQWACDLPQDQPLPRALASTGTAGPGEAQGVPVAAEVQVAASGPSRDALLRPSPADWLLMMADYSAEARRAIEVGRLELATEQLVAAAAGLARWHATLVMFGPAAVPNPNLPLWR